MNDIIINTDESDNLRSLRVFIETQYGGHGEGGTLSGAFQEPVGSSMNPPM